MKFQTAILVAALCAAADATPRRLRKGELRRTQAENEYIEVGADAEEVVVKAKSMKGMSMDGGSARVVDAKAGECGAYLFLGR